MSSGVCPRQAETNEIDDIEPTHPINEAFASWFDCSAIGQPVQSISDVTS